MTIQEDLKEFKRYIGNFDFDLIIMSDKRMAVINQSKNQYIELNNQLMIIDILEYLISTNNSLTDILECNNNYFSTDDYLKHYLEDCQQVV